MSLEGEACNNFNEDFIIVTDNIEFPNSEEGTKLNFNGERFTVTENVNLGQIFEESVFTCTEARFDGGFIVGLETTAVTIFTLQECECSGFLQDEQQKECTIKNYVASN